jgi:sporulation protein YlmC with PRC-barrel domain
MSDLLGAEVTDERGKRLGKVVDVRLVRDGPLAGSWGSLFRVQGLVADRRSFGGRLGLDRPVMRGPLVIKRVFRWIHRDRLFVEWDRVRSIEKGRIRVRTAES